ncbi:MAG: hypothetical protein E7056_05840 [Lentisphaerae bacterium]|nr:hypothetical protein [Lentisphaerota bacterium]
MSSFNETLFAGALIYLLCLLGFLIPLKWIPRWGRLVGYVFFCIINIGLAFIYRGLDFISFNIQSGKRALNFFTELSETLASNTMHIEYLPMPSYTASIIWGSISLLMVIAGFVVLNLKIRWYSYVSTIAALLCAFSILDIQTPHSEKRYISDSNALREKTYSLIEQKRKENVSDKQISEAIRANLKDFRYTYENREDERESSEKILIAIKNLQPETEKEK